MHLSVIVPAFNEAQTLENNIREFDKYLSRQNYDYEIIIINDGSSDNTAAIARELGLKFPRLRFIDNQVNQGKGAAVKQGFQEAEGNFQLFLDADNATSIDHLEKVWEQIENGFDVVIGSRNSLDVAGAWQEIKQPLWKRSLGKAGNLIIQTLTVPGIWDTQCGFKVFSKNSIQKIIPHQTINRWAFDVELLVLAKKNNFKIAKIPVVWKNSAQSRVGIKGYFNSLKEIFKIAWNKFRGKYD